MKRDRQKWRNNMIDIDGISSMTNTYWNNIQKSSASDIESAGSKDYSKASEEELMDVCKEFEAYFLEQMFKAMRNTVPKNEESNSSTYGMFEDNLYQEYAKQSAENGQLGIAQTLFEQMKRNYDLD